MSQSEIVHDAVWVKEERQQWPPTVKLILAFVVGFLLLTPATLGLYWDLILPK